MQDAGFGHFEAIAALEKCGGDADAALELLASGWSPMAALPSVSSDSAPRCPFLSGNASRNTTLPSGHPRVPQVASSTAVVPPPPLADAAADSPLAAAARVMAEKGVPVSQIAALLSIGEAQVAAALAQDASSGAIAGRVLGSSLQSTLDDLLNEDPDLCCPISLVLYSDPVIASDGFLYEKASLETLIKNPTRHGIVSPMTREKLKPDFMPAKQKKKESIEFRQKKSAELLEFATHAAVEQPHMAVTALERVTEYVQVLRPGGSSPLTQTAANLWRQLGRPVPVELARCM